MKGRRHAIAGLAALGLLPLAGCVVAPDGPDRPGRYERPGRPDRYELPDRPDRPEVREIDSVEYEHGCFGCKDAQRVEFVRGRATLTMLGQARFGTHDRSGRAAFTPSEFDALVRRIFDAGFDRWYERYDDGLQDGEWRSITLRSRGVERRVWQRNEAGPAALLHLAGEIEKLAARLDYGARR